MVSVHQVREQLAVFLANEQSLQSFVEWLTRSIWNSTAEESAATRLAGDIELILAEYSEHHIDQQELRRQLSGLTRNHRPNAAASGT
jgi:hypothetical protein